MARASSQPAADHHLAAHPAIGMAGHRADEGEAGGRDRDLAGGGRVGGGLDLRAIGEGEVVERAAVVDERDAVDPCGAHVGYRRLEAQIESMDLDRSDGAGRAGRSRRRRLTRAGGRVDGGPQHQGDQEHGDGVDGAHPREGGEVVEAAVHGSARAPEWD